MFGNKYSGDNIAKEFIRIVELKKKASAEVSALEDDLQNFADDDIPDPSEFLSSLEPSREVSDEVLDQKIDKLDSWVEEVEAGEGLSLETPKIEEEDDFLFDARSAHILNGLGKIAGDLKVKGEFFAADMVQATALSIKKDLVKEANKKLHTISTLKKIAKSIEEQGDRFTADIVEATIDKIKNS